MPADDFMSCTEPDREVVIRVEPGDRVRARVARRAEFRHPGRFRDGADDLDWYRGFA